MKEDNVGLINNTKLLTPYLTTNTPVKMYGGNYLIGICNNDLETYDEHDNRRYLLADEPGGACTWAAHEDMVLLELHPLSYVLKCEDILDEMSNFEVGAIEMYLEHPLAPDFKNIVNYTAVTKMAENKIDIHDLIGKGLAIAIE